MSGSTRCWSDAPNGCQGCPCPGVTSVSIGRTISARNLRWRHAHAPHHPPGRAVLCGRGHGIDLTRAAVGRGIAAIHAGMDEYAVLVFHDQDSRTSSTSPSPEPRAARARLGTSLRRPEDHRLPTTFADVSNLDRDNKPFALDDRRRLFAIGNRLWHSDSSFKVDPGQVLAAACALVSRRRAAIPSSPTCAPPTMRWTTRRRT